VSDSTITFLILAAAVVVFVWDYLPVAIVAVGVALSLWATGVLSLDQALSGFGDPTVIFIASLFVVSEGLDASGVTAWLGQQLTALAGESRTRLLVFTMLLVAGLTALINPNGSVAALLPVAVVTAMRLGRSPSQLLLPLAFGAHAGSLLVLTGSPVNVIVSGAAQDAGVGSFGFFAFALVGVPLVAGTIAIVVLFGDRLIPDRTARTSSRNFSTHARTLVESYELDQDPDELLTPRAGLAEVVVPPRSELIGESVFPGMVSDSGDLIVRAVHRKGENQAEETALAAGDTLLLQGCSSGGSMRLTSSRSTIPGSSGARRCRSASGRGRRSGSSRPWSSCSRRGRCPRPWPACSQQARWSSCACSRSTRPITVSRGRP